MVDTQLPAVEDTPSYIRGSGKFFSFWLVAVFVVFTSSLFVPLGALAPLSLTVEPTRLRTLAP